MFSPYSIGTAMAMALSGARGDTETEMAASLKHRLKRSEIAGANTAVLAILNGYAEVRLLAANALMLTKAGDIRPSP